MANQTRTQGQKRSISEDGCVTCLVTNPLVPNLTSLVGSSKRTTPRSRPQDNQLTPNDCSNDVSATHCLCRCQARSHFYHPSRETRLRELCRSSYVFQFPFPAAPVLYLRVLCVTGKRAPEVAPRRYLRLRLRC